MGFNRRYVDKDSSINALKNNGLANYYGKADALIFEDEISSKIYDLYKSGHNSLEILNNINQNMEDKTDEMYQINQGN